jgi:hypothetical protein
MKKQLVIFVAIFALGALNSFAQSAYTPEKGSSARKAILDALRVPVERELKQKIVFSVDTIKVQGTWAFVNGSPQNTNNETPNYNGTPYQEAIDSEAFDNNFQALLRKTGKKWRVVKYLIGCTDVCWFDWWKTYKAPKAIFPSYENAS